MEIYGLPLWCKKHIRVYNATTMGYDDKIATVYVRIAHFLGWIDTILSERCGCHPLEKSFHCGEPTFFSESCGN